MQMSCQKNLSKNNSWPLLSFSPMPSSSWVACLYCYPLKLSAYRLAVASQKTLLRTLRPYLSCPWAVWASVL